MNRFYPYETLSDPLTLVAETQTLDGVAPPHTLLAAQRSIDLSALEPGWRRATFDLRLEVPRALVGPTAIDLRATLTLNCQATNLRFGIPMAPAARLGSYLGRLEIEAGALARRATLQAVVSATIDGVPARYFGRSEPWNVWVGPPEIPLLSGDLDVKWADFTGDARPAGIDATYRNQAFYVDITADPPVIWLNEGVPDLRRLFDEAPRRSAAEKALREAYFHTIGCAGWLAMFNASLGAIDQGDDGEIREPLVEWQKQVLATILPRIYPDLTPEDALQRAFEDDLDQGGARLLQSRAMAAVNGLLQGTQKLRRAIGALEGTS